MLSKLQQLKEEREQGFTLIELLVVILIIGILAAIAIPAFLNQRKSAVDSSVQSDVSNASKMVETAAIKVGAGNIVLDAAVITTATGTVTVTPKTGDSLTPIVMQVSKGTELSVSGNTRDGYKIIGKNAGGDASKAPNNFTYDSKLGGLKPGVDPAPPVIP